MPTPAPHDLSDRYRSCRTLDLTADSPCPRNAGPAGMWRMLLRWTWLSRRGGAMVWLPRGRLRWVIAGVLVVALVVTVIVAWPYAQRYTGAAAPAQFYEKVQLEPALAPDYEHVLGVAHNAGNNLGTLAKALRYGADVIEIDVISARDGLVA